MLYEILIIYVGRTEFFRLGGIKTVQQIFVSRYQLNIYKPS